MNTKVKLSENEMLLVRDCSFILTKNTIILKAVDLFGEISEVYKKTVSAQNSLPSEVFRISSKIYRGEKYKMLPYVLLDYPRFFDKENIFAIRSFFWWGNFFSISLILKGKYFLKYFPELKSFTMKEWSFYNGDDIWKNDFLNEDFIEGKIIAGNDFLKMSKKIPLNEWNNCFDFFEKNFQELILLLA